MKKTACLILILLMGILGACSAGNDVSTSNNSNDTSATSKESQSIDKQVVLKLGSVNSDKHTLYEGYMKFKEIVEEETNGRVEVQVYPNGQLGDDRSMIEGLQFGTIEGVGVSTSMLANWAPQMMAYDLPFAFQNENVAYQVLDGPFGQKVGNLLEDEGIVFLAYFENGFRHLTTANREVQSVNDLSGLKIRTMQTPLQLDTWNALGANPTPMAYTELFTALQQRVIDGQENPYGNIALDKFYEVQGHLTETKHSYNPMGLVVSKKFYDSLSAEEQAIVKEAAVTAGNYQRQLNNEKTAEYKQTLIDGGMEIKELSPEQYQEFVDKVQSIYEDYADDIGQEYLDEFLTEIEKAQ